MTFEGSEDEECLGLWRSQTGCEERAWCWMRCMFPGGFGLFFGCGRGLEGELLCLMLVYIIFGGNIGHTDLLQHLNRRLLLLLHTHSSPPLPIHPLLSLY